MLKFFSTSSSKKVGTPPGSLEIHKDFPPQEAKVSVIDYDKDEVKEFEIRNIEECFVLRDNQKISWINIDGLKDFDLIRKLGEHFGIHPLVLEDIAHTGQRPKMEDHGKYVYIVVRMLWLNEHHEIQSEQVSLLLDGNNLISFQETHGDIFDLIRERLRSNKGRVRKAGSDYLAYCIMDAIIDQYFVVLEEIGERIAQLEDALMEDAQPEMARQIHYLKREVIYMRRQIWPLREVISGLERNETKLIVKDTRFYLRDAYDHTIQVMDTIESFRDILAGMHDIYLSTISNKMSEVMKVLTIFAAIFIPLTFIAGVYGMNFEYMPELKMKNGYFIVLGAMCVLALCMLIYFKRKKWL